MMEELKLISLKFKNFKGLKAFEIQPDGKNLEIKGDNATGKTTVFDGVTWLFFGKDSSGRSDFQLKPVDKKGDEIHNLDTEIEGIVDFKDKQTTLKKRYKELWTKKHGSATKEFTSHSTDYFIDEVPVKKAEYEIFIKEIIDTDIFKLVTSPLEFNNLHWQKRREILISICGEVSDLEVINSDKKLSALKTVLGDCSIDDHKKKIASKKRDINKELELIPARIDEVTLSIKDVEKVDQTKVDELSKSFDEKTEELRKVKSNEALSEKRVELSTVKNEILKEKSKAYDSTDTATEPFKKEITILKLEKQKISSTITDLETSISTDEERNLKTGAALKELRAEWNKITEKEPSVKSECPACGQDLPEYEIEAAIGKFNNAKAEDIKTNVAKGKSLKQGLEDRDKDIEKNKKQLIELDKTLSEKQKAIEVQEKELELLIQTPLEVDTLKLEEKQVVIKAEIEELENNLTAKIKDLEAAIEIVKNSLNIYGIIEAQNKASESAKLRIKELEEQEQTLAKEYEKLEGQLFLIQEFIVKKVEALEEKINSKFELARFKMFNVQVNQGIEECCETIYNGVPFNHGLNSAARINVGLDIINALSEHYGFRSVIFVDNKESVNEVTETKAQVISLTVTRDKKLTIS